MNLNLCIHPLEVVEDFVSQKCLLPKCDFARQNIRPGEWVKCMWNDGNAFSVCQIFPRDMKQRICYLDKCVASKQAHDNDKECILKRIQPLQESIVNEIGLVFEISEQLLRTKRKHLSLDYLICAASELLQHLRLTVSCKIQTKELLELGISVYIDEVVGCTNNDTCFAITDETTIKVNDVRLLNVTLSMPEIISSGFEAVRAKLQDLLHLVAIQNTTVNTLCVSHNALLVGPTGCGKSTLAAAFITENQCNYFRVLSADVLGEYPGEIETKLREIFNSARVFQQLFKPKAPTIILLEDLQLLCPVISKSNSNANNSNVIRASAQLLALVDELQATRSNIICLATTTDPDMLTALARRPGRFEREITIASPNLQQRQQLCTALFRQSFLAEPTSELLALIAQQTQGYVMGDLCLMLSHIEQAMLREPTLEMAAAISNALKNCKPVSVRSTDIKVIKTQHGFDAIGGMQQLKRILEVSVLAGLQNSAAFQRFGLSLPKGVLLYGPPGCAKTTIAKCLASEAHMSFIHTSGAEVYSPYIGCAERFVAKIFDTARKNAPCLIFLDEIDTLVGRRATNSTATSDVQLRILSTLLTEMDGIIGGTNANSESCQHILVVAATNRPDMIDEALLRPGRFDKLIHVPAPDETSRLSIFGLHACRMPFAADVDLGALAKRTAQYSGADICNLCNEAAMQAFQRDCETLTITVADFEYVLCTQKSSLSQRQIDWYFDFENKFLR